MPRSQLGTFLETARIAVYDVATVPTGMHMPCATMERGEGRRIREERTREYVSWFEVGTPSIMYTVVVTLVTHALPTLIPVFQFSNATQEATNSLDSLLIKSTPGYLQNLYYNRHYCTSTTYRS